MNAQSQEPVFILRGGDPHAAAAVDRYADLVEAARGDVGTLGRARHAAQQMRAWRAANPAAVEAPSAPMLPVARPADDGTAEAMSEAGVEPGDVIAIPGEGDHVVGAPAKRGRKS